MRKVTTAIVFMLAASLLLYAGKEETLEQLKARAAAAKPADQVGLFLQIAERQLKAADDAFNAGDAGQGHAAVTDVVSYAERAGEAARTSRKNIKNAEIHIRKIARRLDDIRRTLNFEDRAPLQAGVDRLEHVRTELLAQMFEHR
jgi:hypothetical protein